MESIEREVLTDLIGSVRTLAQQTLTLHLQLGAVRILLARKGTITNAELSAIMTELGVMTSIEELTAADAPPPDEVFDELLRRLSRPSMS